MHYLDNDILFYKEIRFKKNLPLSTWYKEDQKTNIQK